LDLFLEKFALGRLEVPIASTKSVEYFLQILEMFFKRGRKYDDVVEIDHARRPEKSR